MTDFLSSLIARNLELVAVIQPRLASRFESASPMSGSLQGGYVWDAQDVEAQQSGESEPTDHVRKTSPPQSSEPPPESPLPVADFQDKPATRRPIQAPDQKHPEDASQQSVGAQDRNVAVQTRPSLKQTSEKAPHAGDPRPVGSEGLPVSPLARPAATLAVPGKPTQPEQSENSTLYPRLSSAPPIQPALVEPASPSRGRPGTEPPILPASQVARPEGIMAPPPVVSAVQAAPSAHAEPARMSQSQTPPVIRISIGRVEVRAVMAPPALPLPRPPARSGPSLSLEDYLKGREEGKR